MRRGRQEAEGRAGVTAGRAQDVRGLLREPRTFVDFSLSGSYRVENLLRLYDWLLPTVADAADAIVLVQARIPSR